LDPSDLRRRRWIRDRATTLADGMREAGEGLPAPRHAVACRRGRVEAHGIREVCGAVLRCGGWTTKPRPDRERQFPAGEALAPNRAERTRST
jgi:hypothetical protein